jgi:hypothetical protein
MIHIAKPYNNIIMTKSKKHRLLILKALISLIITVWPQLSTNSAQAHCIPSLSKNLEIMNNAKPLMINEALIIEDIKKAYKALANQDNDPRVIALQFGTIDTTSPSENEVKPFNHDVQSLFVYNDVINFNFRPHSLISLASFQKAFGNYITSPARTNRTGSITTYSIRFIIETSGKNTYIIVRRRSPDLTAEKIEISEISVVN